MTVSCGSLGPSVPGTLDLGGGSTSGLLKTVAMPSRHDPRPAPPQDAQGLLSGYRPSAGLVPALAAPPPPAQESRLCLAKLWDR